MDSLLPPGYVELTKLGVAVYCTITGAVLNILLRNAISSAADLGSWPGPNSNFSHSFTASAVDNRKNPEPCQEIRTVTGNRRYCPVFIGSSAVNRFTSGWISS